MPSLYKAVSALLQGPEEKVSVKQLRALIKENDELSAIKLYGKGRTKANIMKDLRIWLKRASKEELQEQEYKSNEDIDTAQQMLLLARSNRPAMDTQINKHLLSEIAKIIDFKLSPLNSNLMEIQKMILQLTMKVNENHNQNYWTKLVNYGITSHPPYNQQAAIQGNNEDMSDNTRGLCTRIFFFFFGLFMWPYKCVWWITIWSFRLIRDSIIQWTANAVFRPIKWLLFPVSIMISLYTLIAIIHLIGVGNINQYIMLTLGQIGVLFKIIFGLIGKTIYWCLPSVGRNVIDYVI